jgi:hypothetical protein
MYSRVFVDAYAEFFRDFIKRLTLAMKLAHRQNIILGKNRSAMSTASSDVTGTRPSFWWTRFSDFIHFNGSVFFTTVETTTVAFGNPFEMICASNSRILAGAFTTPHFVLQFKK